MSSWNAPVSKYNGEQNERYGGPLQWPGVHGYPVIGDGFVSLKQHEVEALPIHGTAHEKVFDLNDEKDREYYNWVRDRIRNGMFTRDFEERRWPADARWPTIYLEWTQLAVTCPAGGITRSTTHGSARQFTLRHTD